MTSMYPVVFTPHKEDASFHVEFLDLEYCAADGPDLEDAIKNARYATHNRLRVESEGGIYDFPLQSHYDGITLE